MADLQKEPSYEARLHEREMAQLRKKQADAKWEALAWCVFFVCLAAVSITYLILNHGHTHFQ